MREHGDVQHIVVGGWGEIERITDANVEQLNNAFADLVEADGTPFRENNTPFFLSDWGRSGLWNPRYHVGTPSTIATLRYTHANTRCVTIHNAS